MIGFSIDTIYFGTRLVASLKRKQIPKPGVGVISVFVLPAWGISGLMYFGKPPEEIVKVWNSFLIVLLIAFCVHLFICIGLPFLLAMVCNLFYGRRLLDMSPLPSKNLGN